MFNIHIIFMWQNFHKFVILRSEEIPIKIIIFKTFFHK